MQNQKREELIVRTATRDDWEAIYKLYNSLTEEDLYMRFFHFYRLSVEDAVKMSEGGDHVTFLAFSGNRLVGEATLHMTGEVSLVTDRDYRGKGIGSVLMRHLLSVARALGIKEVRFYTLPENLPMISLGRKFGFKVVLEGDEVIGTLELTPSQASLRLSRV